jgi:hypothetical protein
MGSHILCQVHPAPRCFRVLLGGGFSRRGRRSLLTSPEHIMVGRLLRLAQERYVGRPVELNGEQRPGVVSVTPELDPSLLW